MTLDRLLLLGSSCSIIVVLPSTLQQCLVVSGCHCKTLRIEYATYPLMYFLNSVQMKLERTIALKYPGERGRSKNWNALILHSGAGQPDYKTDYIPAGRSWTTLDDASPKTANSRAIWTALDESGLRAECSKIAGCRFDSCPTNPPAP
jgi:hypothetical protein